MNCASQGSIKVVKMHLKLWEAATSGDENQILSLSKEDLLEVTANGNSMLHIAAKLGHLDLAKALCIKCPPLLLLRNMKGDTPLHCASGAGHFEIVEFLHPLSGEVSAIRNKAGNTALHEAARAGCSRAVDLLMFTYTARLGGCGEQCGDILSLHGSGEGVFRDCNDIAEVSGGFACWTARPDSFACSCSKKLRYNKTDTGGKPTPCET